MGHAIATFTAAAQATTDDTSNPTTFKPGPVDVALSDDGSFSGTVQLRRRFSRNSAGTKTSWEVVQEWTDTDLPVHVEFTYVDGYEWQLYCQARAAGSCYVRMGN